MSTTSLRSLFSGLSLSTTTPLSSTACQRISSTLVRSPTTAIALTPLQRRSFSFTSPAPAKADKSSKKKRKKGKGDEPDPRIQNLKVSNPRKVPAPLRFARNRALRHWTIHRAWLLFQRKEREREEKELARLYQSMHAACEELRQTSGPGTQDEGYLYRVAMEKKGVFKHHNFPIEYARPQVETPAREPWNHGWTR
ncbi:mitochondrial 54S ribosomal protein mL40 [Apiospora aurea]|uniref:Large ribosomal subunit protein mL40 n=1 Tax=Apiospora aurea TaxID=335848 RepID=A0ABR1PXV5_9PEZI